MDASFHIKPFAFDRVFVAAPANGAGGSDQIHELRAEIEALKLQLEIGLEVAHADGVEAGLVQAREEIASALLAATDALHASIEAVENEYEAIEERLSTAASELAMAAAEGLAARALENDPALAVDAAIARVLMQVARGQELHVRVHSAIVGRMEALIAARQSQERRRLSIHVIADDSLSIGDALITWEQGGLTLDAAARRKAILAELGLARS